MKSFLIFIFTITFWPLDAIGDEKFGSSYEAWQACDEYAEEQYIKKNGVIGCEEDTPTKQILALDEDTEKVIKVFKY